MKQQPLTDTLLPHQRSRVLAAIKDHCSHNHKANATSTWYHMVWCFQDDTYWLHKKEIKQLVTKYFTDCSK